MYTGNSFTEFCKNLFSLPLRYDDTFYRLVGSGLYDLILLDRLFFLVKTPLWIKRDEENKVHSEDGPAIAWDDGYTLYFLHGVNLTKELWQGITTHTTSPRDILALENPELWRAAKRL